MKTLGLRHAALHVRDPQKSKEFYLRVLRMQLEWEPDPDNVYLTSEGQDNLALHRSTAPAAGSDRPLDSKLDHLGFALSNPNDVDDWCTWVRSQGVPILREVKTHRDGARSFYFSDPDGIVIQMIYHPPISERENQRRNS